MATKFFCEDCNYGTDILGCYKQHLETTLHKTGKRKERSDKKIYKCYKCIFENDHKTSYLNHILNNHSTIEERKQTFPYYCECCDFGVFIKSVLDIHLKTKKHSLKFKEFEERIREENEKKKIKCQYCNVEYSNRHSLSRHKKKCNKKEQYCTVILETQPNQSQNDNSVVTISNGMSIITETETNGITVNKEVLTELVKQNREFQNMLVEQHRELTEKIEELSRMKNNVTINNKFNFNVFLNEYCKDALNISEFANSIQVNLQDLEYVGIHGYVEGITKILLNGLKELDLYKRPLHCTDIKREVIHIKDDDNKWNKDDENKKVKKLISRVANKNVAMVGKWQDANPEYEELDSRMYKLWSKIVKESINVGKYSERNDDIVLHNIAKSVYVDRKKLGDEIKAYSR